MADGTVEEVFEEREDLMSDEPILNGKKEEPKDVVLTITMSRDKGLSVEGPGNGTYFDEMMIYFLLEKAKDHVKMSNAMRAKEDSKNGIITAGGRIRGMFRK